MELLEVIYACHYSCNFIYEIVSYPHVVIILKRVWHYNPNPNKLSGSLITCEALLLDGTFHDSGLVLVKTCVVYIENRHIWLERRFAYW
jgi:hypothetical protein